MAGGYLFQNALEYLELRRQMLLRADLKLKVGTKRFLHPFKGNVCSGDEPILAGLCHMVLV